MAGYEVTRDQSPSPESPATTLGKPAARGFAGCHVPRRISASAWPASLRRAGSPP
jgi:hypothetical protein